MKLLKIFPLVAVCSTAPAYAQSQFDELDVKDLSPTTVDISDEVTGGCWTNAGEAKSYAEDQLRLAGVKVVEDDTSSVSSVLLIQVLGERSAAGFCIGAFNLSFVAGVEFRDKEVFAVLHQQNYYFLNLDNANIMVLDGIRSFL